MATSGFTANNIVYPISTDSVNLSADLTAMANSVQNNFIPNTGGTITTTVEPGVLLRREGGAPMLGMEANHSTGPANGKKWGLYVSNSDYHLRIRPYNDNWSVFGNTIGIDRSANLTLAQDPSSALHAATKQYVDSARHPNEMYAFSYRNSTTQNMSATANTPSIMTFNTVRFNGGGVWNTTNNEFTAPVNGVYMFNTQVNFSSGAGNVKLRWEEYIAAWATIYETWVPSVVTYSHFANSTLVHRMTAGTKIRLQGFSSIASHVTGSATVEHQNRIHGFLISSY